MEHIGYNIRKIRKRNGLTMAQMARKLTQLSGEPITIKVYGSWERGESKLDADLIPLIAQALGCTICRIYSVKPESKSSAVNGLTLLERYLHLPKVEQDIIWNAAAEWDGNIHALIGMVGIYISLPPRERADVSLMSILKFESTDERVETAPQIDIEYIQRQWDVLVKK